MNRPALFITSMVGVALLTSVVPDARSQVVIVKPDPARRSASATTTIMLSPLLRAEGFHADEAHAVPVPGGGEMLSHPELGMSYIVAETRPDGTLRSECLDHRGLGRRHDASGTGEPPTR